MLPARPAHVPADVWYRFWRYCEHDSPSACWLWVGSLSSGRNGGYGRFEVGRRPTPSTSYTYTRRNRSTTSDMRNAHRWLYEQLIGPVSPGLVLDHLCSVRHCCNPAHLEPVSLAENARRGGMATSLRRTGQLVLPLEWS